MESEVENKVGKSAKKHPFRKNRYIHHGQNIGYFRDRAGLSQKELGQKLNKSQQYISQLEDQEVIDEEVIIDVAKALDIDPQYITDWMTDNAANIFNIENMGQGEGSTNMVGTNNFETNHEVHIYPIDKVCELYDVIRKQDKELYEKDLTIKQLEIDNLKKEIDYYKNK